MAKFVALWLDSESEKKMMDFRIFKKLHLTTFYDAHHQFKRNMTHFELAKPITATIQAVTEWKVGENIYLIAEIPCEEAAQINKWYASQYQEGLPFKSHITLIKCIKKGESAEFQHLVGMSVTFNRHGFED